MKQTRDVKSNSQPCLGMRKFHHGSLVHSANISIGSGKRNGLLGDPNQKMKSIKVIVVRDDIEAIAFVEKAFSQNGCNIPLKNLRNNNVFILGGIPKDNVQSFLNVVFPGSLPPEKYIDRIINVI